MKRVDDIPIDPEVAASLDAIDATLAGRPVDAKFAELAELALLLRSERPRCSAEFATEMDARVARRFAPGPTAAAVSGAAVGGGRPRRWRRLWSLSPAWGSGIAAALGAVVVAVVLVSAGSHPARLPVQAGASSSAQASSSAAGTPQSRAPGSVYGGRPSSGSSHRPARAPSLVASSSSTSASAASSSASVPAPASFSATSTTTQSASPTNTQTPAPSSTSTGSVNGAPVPLPSGRKIIQSGQLVLNAPAAKIDAVAQEVFNVVGAENGIVNHSSVTASGTPSGYAQFELSIPSGNLQQTMNALSRLQYATVSSRSDNTQDVTGQDNGDVRRLNDAKAARTALLKQLAAATTTEQVDSLHAQIENADAQISADQSTLNGLNHQVDYSQVQVTINGTASAGPVTHGGFTLPTAFRDAGHVLTVVAGVALVALSALLPLAVLAALGWMITVVVRRHRREHALDLA
jgi:Domain of unknown function (DUF4349)